MNWAVKSPGTGTETRVRLLLGGAGRGHEGGLRSGGGLGSAEECALDPSGQRQGLLQTWARSYGLGVLLESPGSSH